MPRSEPPILLPAVSPERFAPVPAPCVAGGTAGRPAGGSAGADADEQVLRLLPVLGALDPEAARRVRGGLPRCDSTFGVGLAFFLAAAADGARDWLGTETAGRIDALDGGALLDDLEDALLPHARRTADGRSWRVLRLPVLAEDGVRRLTCAVAVGEGMQTGCTVALQIRLPVLGAVQLIAAIEGRRLDVTLQTADGLPAPLLAELHAGFAGAVADAGLTGTLTIGPVIGAWLDLDEELRADTTA
ncbi:MAG TPA: hypothetical protein VD995_01475 [Azospirillum sp.]|nr:hypothetical protein [Azospirillum sp.]